MTKRTQRRTAPKTGWLVPYSATFRGTAYIEAESAEAAKAVVESGAFEVDAGAEMSDWSATGTPRADE